VKITKNIASESSMLELAAQLARSIAEGAVIFLSGPLGAGKTTFTRGFLRGLGYDSKVKSPTYTLVEPYEIAGRNIFHFDFYRLNHASELEHIGINEYFFPAAICLIEWPEKGFPLLPEPDLTCSIAFADNGREVTIAANTARGIAALQQLPT
jgi:tRNA threonylcarbamoyladenosine biosynthesis protein TsaE